MNILILTRYENLGASSRIRSYRYFPWFTNAGFKITTNYLVNDTQLCMRYQKNKYSLFDFLKNYWQRIRILMSRRNFDLVWIEKEALPWFPVWFERILLRGVPYVLDFDDAIFHNYDLHSSAWIRWIYGRRIDRLMAGARLVIAGNFYLAQRAHNAGASWVEIVPTVIDLDRYMAKPASVLSGEPLRIVWIGSPSTTRYLKLLQEPFAILSQRFFFRFIIIGGDKVDLPGMDVEFVQWSEATEVALIQACDIGVMPLSDSPWEQGKCGYKLIQYMACGLPVIASPVGVNTEIIRVGENGFLANSVQEWVDALTRLLSDADLRQQMGRLGRQYVIEKYTFQLLAPRMVNLLRSAAEGS
ncbi:hypothetical protein CCP3SC5AM1_800009 [Gammaproteobacteria bacterium]